MPTPPFNEGNEKMKIDQHEVFIALQKEYLTLLIDEFNEVIHKHGSEYFSRLEKERKGIIQKRQPSYDPTKKIEKIEKQLFIMMDKMHLDSDQHPISYVYDYIDSIQDNPERYTGGSKYLAKSIVKKISQQLSKPEA